MTHPKHSNSSLRYSIARLKPLINVKVWGSVGIMALVGFLLWQYHRHPEWVGDNQLPGSSIEGKFEGEVGNNLDIGVTLQDLEQNRLNNSEGVPLPPSQLNDDFLQSPSESLQGNQISSNNDLIFPSSGDKDNPQLNPQPNPSVKFEPLMPNVKNLDSLFPPLKPDKNAGKPIQIPDYSEQSKQRPQNSVLQNAIEEVFSQESPSVEPPAQPSRENKQPSPNTNRSPQPNFPTSGRNNPYSGRPQTPPNNPYTYSPTQPYNQPYGNGRPPAPIPAYPPSPQSGNPYNNGNPNFNYSNPSNQNQPAPNYGIQPPQVDGF
ncbi:hypothetical protein [Crocosphaera sp. Alani8]|uniref:hypothetical protein n=1 Tax=Crocosphaera sp. Alani8 TaxID=3038952 RepID=UPI00313D7990